MQEGGRDSRDRGEEIYRSRSSSTLAEEATNTFRRGFRTLRRFFSFGRRDNAVMDQERERKGQEEEEEEEVNEDGFVVVRGGKGDGDKVMEINDIGELKITQEQDTIPRDIRENEYLQFPFLVDPKSKKWVEENKVVFVMRGLSGSGKSTVVESITRVFPEAVVCSADHFFVELGNGVYQFDASRLKDAHADSQRRFQSAMDRRVKTIVVDNTNVMRWEMNSYVNAAGKHAYPVILVESKTPWRMDPKELAAKNSHGVPEEVLRNKVKQFELVLPLYYAFFLSDGQSQTLLKLGLSWLRKCIDNCQEFVEDFKGFSRATSLAAMLHYFSRDMCLPSNKRIVHCTAKFCGKDPTKASKDYAKSKTVLDSLGRVFDLSVIGFVITKDTFGARVELTGSELDLYDQPEGGEEARPPTGARRKSSKKKRDPWLTQDEIDDMTSVPDDADLVLKERLSETVDDRFFPIPGRGKRAHVTLGTSEGILPVVTGIDLLDAVKLEEKAAKEPGWKVPTFDVGDGAVLRQYDPGRLWVLYPGKTAVFEALFTGHY